MKDEMSDYAMERWEMIRKSAEQAPEWTNPYIKEQARKHVEYIKEAQAEKEQASIVRVTNRKKYLLLIVEAMVKSGDITTDDLSGLCNCN